MFAVQATVTVKSGAWTTTRSVPTFYLHETVQGILTEEHAEEVALEVLDPTGNLRTSPYHTFNITACQV
jgi:hypothetical protein